jgi:cytochrome c-type biogenesis protein CcmH
MKFILALFLLLPLSAHAIEAGEALAEPKLEARALALGYMIRCVVCEGQSVNDSAATMAKNMRALIREQIKAGLTDQEIRDYLAKRYGDVILFNPPVKGETLPLWFAPWLILALSVGGYAYFLRRHKKRFQR